MSVSASLRIGDSCGDQVRGARMPRRLIDLMGRQNNPRRVVGVITVLAASAAVALTVGSANALWSSPDCKLPSSSLLYRNDAPSSPKNYYAAANNAASQWSSATNVNLTLTTGAATIQYVALLAGPTGYHARTIRSCGSSAQVQFNRTYMDMSEWDVTNRRRSTASHETGHALGAEHAGFISPCSGARVMYTNISRFDTCGIYTAVAADIAEIDAHYP